MPPADPSNRGTQSLTSCTSLRPQWVVYSASPEMTAGLNALRRQIRARGCQAPKDVLGLISALRELEAVCDAVTSGRAAPNHTNRVSLVSDVQCSLGGLGPALAEQIAPLLPDFKKQVGGLVKALDAVPATRTIGLAVRSLLQRLTTIDSVAAAWRDVVTTYLDLKSSPECCEARVLQLVELAENRGVDYDAWASKAERILGDEAQLLATLGEKVAPVRGHAAEPRRTSRRRWREASDPALRGDAKRTA